MSDLDVGRSQRVILADMVRTQVRAPYARVGCELTCRFCRIRPVAMGTQYALGTHPYARAREAAPVVRSLCAPLRE